MTTNYHPPFGKGNKNRLLSADDVRIILNSNRLYHDENIPGVDFHPDTPMIYGKACAYDMAFRLMKWCRRNGRTSDARAIWSEFSKILFQDDQYLVRLIDVLGRKYHDFVNSHSNVGWLNLDTSLDVWRNNTFIAPAVRALCAILAFRGLPFMEFDGGFPRTLSFPDFSPCGVFESEKDALEAGMCFCGAFREIEESVFGKSMLSANRPYKTECLLAYGSFERAVLPKIALQPYGNERLPGKYISGIKMSLALRRRSFGDIVPVDISFLSPFFVACLHCEQDSEKMPGELLDNLTNEQTDILNALFGDPMSDEPAYDPSVDCDPSMEGTTVEVSETESRKYEEFDLRGWIDAKFGEAVSDDWSGDEYRTGRIKCLSGLRLAAERITDDKSLYATVADLCSAWLLIGQPLFQTCDIDDESSCQGSDCHDLYYTPLSLAVDFARKCRKDGVFVCDEADSAWPLMTGIFTDHVDNLLAVIFAHDIQNFYEKDEFSTERLAGWNSPISELADILLDEYGAIREELVDRANESPIPLWGMAFTKGSIAVRCRD